MQLKDLKQQLLEEIKKTKYLFPETISNLTWDSITGSDLSGEVLTHLGSLWDFCDPKYFLTPVRNLDTTYISTLALLIQILERPIGASETLKCFSILDARGYSLFYYISSYSSLSIELGSVIPELLNQGCNPYQATCFLNTSPFCAAILAENYAVVNLFLKQKFPHWSHEKHETRMEKLNFWNSLAKRLGQGISDWKNAGLHEQEREKCFDCVLEIYDDLGEDTTELADAYTSQEDTTASQENSTTRDEHTDSDFDESDSGYGTKNSCSSSQSSPDWSRNR